MSGFNIKDPVPMTMLEVKKATIEALKTIGRADDGKPALPRAIRFVWYEKDDRGFFFITHIAEMSSESVLTSKNELSAYIKPDLVNRQNECITVEKVYPDFGVELD